MGNPYLSIHRRMRRHRPVPWARMIPVLAAGIAIPLVSGDLFWFLAAAESGLDVKQWVPGLVAVTTRFANLVAAAVILHSYTDLVRGPDRAILDVHPVSPRPLVVAIGLHTLGSRLYLPLMAAILLLPVGLSASWMAYLGSVALIVAAWIGGIGVGFMVNLAAVWAAYSPGLTGLLDAIRGQNPRMQAALIYAPGVALALVGLSVEFGAIGLEAALTGWSLGWAWLAIPLMVGLVAWSLVGTLADHFYVRASLLLAEVEGAWGQHDESVAAGVVYMQRVARGRPELLRALRHGWRSQRLYATGGWITGLVVAGMCWSDPDTGAVWGAGAVVLIAAVAARMSEGDPLWLDDALGVSRTSVAWARATVAWLYTVGVWGPVGAVLSLRHGMDGLEIGIGLVVLSLAVALASAFTALLWHKRAIWAYGATGIVAWAGFVSVMG
jgi:hypothetical protein